MNEPATWDDAHRVFGIKGVEPIAAESNSGHSVISFMVMRDSQECAFGKATAAERRVLLGNALWTGDEVLAHAVVHSAVVEGDADTVIAFAAAYPHLAGAVGRLWDAASPWEAEDDPRNEGICRLARLSRELEAAGPCR